MNGIDQALLMNELESLRAENEELKNENEGFIKHIEFLHSALDEAMTELEREQVSSNDNIHINMHFNHIILWWLVGQ